MNGVAVAAPVDGGSHGEEADTPWPSRTGTQGTSETGRRRAETARGDARGPAHPVLTSRGESMDFTTPPTVPDTADGDSRAGSDFAELSRQVQDAGLLRRRPVAAHSC